MHARDFELRNVQHKFELPDEARKPHFTKAHNAFMSFKRRFKLSLMSDCNVIYILDVNFFLSCLSSANRGRPRMRK